MPPAPERSLEEEIAVARDALAKGELAHCAVHLASALVEAPESLEVDELVSRLFAGIRDPLSLADLEADTYVGTALLRSRFLERLGRTGEALELLLRAQHALPDRSLLVGIERFVEHPDAFDAEDLEGIAAALFPLCSGRNAARFLPLLQALRERHEVGVGFRVVLAKCLRATGAGAQALEVSRELTEIAPSKLAFIAFGSALRDMGRTDEAIAAWRCALEHEPTSVPVRLDIGDAELARGRYEAALQTYRAALELAPGHPWALPSSLYVRWKLYQDADARGGLIELAARSERGSRARDLCDEAAPYRYALPPPDNSLMNSGRYALVNCDAVTACAVSSLEAPSTVATFREEMRSLSPEQPEISYAEMPAPDPRIPFQQVERVLWSYSTGGLFSRVAGLLGTSARRAVRSPPAAVMQRVLALASTPYLLDEWTSASRSIASSFSTADIDALMACMVHSPPPPASDDPWEYRFAVQVAAGFIISHVGDGWDGAPRRQALHDLLCGPVDWTTSAAIIATCNLARVEPQRSRPVCELLSPLLSINGGPIHWANICEPLERCADWIADPSPRFTQWVQRVRATQAQTDRGA